MPSTPTTSSRKWNLKDICSGTRAPSSQTNIWRRSSKGHDNSSWKARPRSNCAAGTAMPPNFVLLDTVLPDVARLVAAMLHARDTIEHRSWSHPQEPTGEAWWADVLADPRARKRERRTDLAIKKAFYGSPMKSGSSFAFDTLDSSVALVVRMGSATYPFRAFTDIRWSHLLGNISIIDARRPMPTASSGAPKPGELSLQSPQPPRANEVME